MSNHKDLTNEQLNQRFENPFKMVNHAINLAHQLIERGEERESNPAIDILMMIEHKQDRIEPITSEEAIS